MIALCLLLAAAEPQEWPLEITVLQEAVGMPGLAGGDVFTTGPHPGLTIGTSYRYLRRGLFSLLQTATLGGFYHGPPKLDGFYALTELTPRIELPFGLGFEAALGAGYFQPIGLPAALISVRLGVRYMFPGRRIGLVAAYQVMLETPTALAPILPRSLLHLGVSIPLAR